MLIISLVIFLGSFVQSLTGFGLGLVSVSLLSLCIGVKLAVPLVSIFGWLVTIPVVYRMRNHIAYKDGIIMVIGSIPGGFLGAWLLYILPSNAILMIMGVMLVLSSTYNLLSKNSKFQLKSTLWGFLFGLLSGGLGAAVASPSPPVLAYLSFKKWNANKLKATLMFFFMLQMIFALISFYMKDLMTIDVISGAIWGLPGFIVGIILGILTFEYMQKKNFNYQKIVNIFLIIIGLKIIWQSHDILF